jgi:transposase
MSDNRKGLRSGVGKVAPRLRVERVDRSFAHLLDRGGIRRTYLRGRKKVQKRRLVYVADVNPGLILRALVGAGIPKGLAVQGAIIFWLVDPATNAIVILVLPPGRPETRSSATAVRSECNQT